MSFVAARAVATKKTRVFFALDARFLFGTPPERRGIQRNAIDEAIKVRHDAASTILIDARASDFIGLLPACPIIHAYDGENYQMLHN